MTGVEVALIGSALAGSAGTATAAAGASGLFGALTGGIAATTAGATAGAGLFGSLGTLGTLSALTSVGSAFFGQQASSAESEASQVAAKANLAQERSRTARELTSAYREQGLREGSARATAGAQGRSATGSVLDILEMNTAQSELDILGARESLQYTTALTNSRVSASKSSAKMQKYSGILSGASKLASMGV